VGGGMFTWSMAVMAADQWLKAPALYSVSNRKLVMAEFTAATRRSWNNLSVYLLAKSFVADFRPSLYTSIYSNKNVDVFKSRLRLKYSMAARLKIIRSRFTLIIFCTLNNLSSWKINYFYQLNLIAEIRYDAGTAAGLPVLDWTCTDDDDNDDVTTSVCPSVCQSLTDCETCTSAGSGACVWSVLLGQVCSYTLMS